LGVCSEGKLLSGGVNQRNTAYKFEEGIFLHMKNAVLICMYQQMSGAALLKTVINLKAKHNKNLTDIFYPLE
jgi:hypothetical protein